jgi:hypothetical protein
MNKNVKSGLEYREEWSKPELKKINIEQITAGKTKDGTIADGFGPQRPNS